MLVRRLQNIGFAAIGFVTYRLTQEPPPPQLDDLRAVFTYDNPIDPGDCAELDSLKPDARPGWQARVRSACQ
jgi:hypothetical protein